DEPGWFGSELNRLLGGAVAVAAAGNDSTARPYFPRALPAVVGVGGLATPPRALFSNFGSGVDGGAPAGAGLGTSFAALTKQPDGRSTRRFDGWARWSGTSFAAPKVAAAIAQELYLGGGSARHAWHRLVSSRRLRYADLGTVFNI